MKWRKQKVAVYSGLSGRSESSTLTSRTRCSYFVATYPPFSAWRRRPSSVWEGGARRNSSGQRGPLGLYLHIPFCRKRCHFYSAHLYFRVYTDKNAQEVGEYLDVLAREWELCSQKPAIVGRPLNFVYFGGGTPRSCRRNSWRDWSAASRR